MRFCQLIGVGIVISGLAGCLSLSHEEQPIHTFILRPDLVSGEAAPAVKPGGGTLVVNVPVAQPGFDTPRMAYVQRAFELSYYATHQWAEPPALMVTPLLVQALEQTGFWRAIISMPTAVRGNHRVDIDQVELFQTFLRKPSQVRLALRVQLIALPDHVVQGTRLFEAVEEARTDDAYGGAVAANLAVERLVRDVAAWLGGCAVRGAGCSR